MSFDFDRSSPATATVAVTMGVIVTSTGLRFDAPYSPGGGKLMKGL
jgi:hypothetical protein